MQEQLQLHFPSTDYQNMLGTQQSLRVAPLSKYNCLKFLQQHFKKPIRVHFTKNRSTMLSFTEERDFFKLRLHEFFLKANNIELQALVQYLQSHDKVSGEIIDTFIDRIAGELPPKYQKITVKGRFFDLQKLFDHLNREHFHAQCSARITWGKAQHKRRRKSIQLGLYYYDENIIVIHQALDQSFVPEYYLSWIIYHEMLHEIIGCEKAKSRRKLHPPEFVALEECFPAFDKCKAWEHGNLNRLLYYKPRP